MVQQIQAEASLGVAGNSTPDRVRNVTTTNATTATATTELFDISTGPGPAGHSCSQSPYEGKGNGQW